MSSNTLTVRVDARVKAAVAGLVERGAYGSITEFVVEAILLKLDLEGVPVEPGGLPPDPIAAYFATPWGQETLRTAIRRALAEMAER